METKKLTSSDVNNLKNSVLEFSGNLCVTLNKVHSNLDTLISSLPDTKPSSCIDEEVHANYVSLYEKVLALKSAVDDCRNEVIPTFCNI